MNAAVACRQRGERLIERNSQTPPGIARASHGLVLRAAEAHAVNRPTGPNLERALRPELPFALQLDMLKPCEATAASRRGPASVGCDARLHCSPRRYDQQAWLAAGSSAPSRGRETALANASCARIADCGMMPHDDSGACGVQRTTRSTA